MKQVKWIAAGLSALALAACGAGEDAAKAVSQPERPVWVTPDLQPDDLLQPDGSVLQDAEGRPLGYRGLGRRLAPFEARLLDGSDISTADLEGRWTVIDVWGIWCSDCMADAPYTAALATAVAQDPDLDFLSIHTPPSAARADEAFGKFGSVEAFFASKGYSYPTVLDTDAAVRDAMQVDWTPTYLLVGPDLTVEAFTTDLSIAGDQPVKALLAAVARIKASKSD